MTQQAWLLIGAVIAVAALIVLIARYKINPFITLFSVSILLALATGMPAGTVVKSFETGMGNTLGHIAIVIALGTMLGKMLAESGGADRIAKTFIDLFGKDQVHWAMMIIGFIVGLPVFFEVGFVLLIPIAFNVAARTGKPMLLVALPMIAAISVVHGLVPPHPAALFAVENYHADMGFTILLGLIVGLPTAAVAGPLFAMFISKRVHLPAHNPLAEQFLRRDDSQPLPSFVASLLTILMPVILMLIGSGADLVAAKGSGPNQFLHFLGNTDVALLLGVIVSFWSLGTARGFSRDAILKFTNDCLAPTATVIILVGAGGGFGNVLRDSGVAKAIVDMAQSAHVPVLLFSWLLAAFIRVSTGSATVAMTTAVGIVAPLATQTAGIRPELLVLATGSGSLIFSHVNDGGFWLIKQYLNMTVAQTFRTWSVLETIISVVGLALTLGLSLVL